MSIDVDGDDTCVVFGRLFLSCYDFCKIGFPRANDTNDTSARYPVLLAFSSYELEIQTALHSSSADETQDGRFVLIWRRLSCGTHWTSTSGPDCIDNGHGGWIERDELRCAVGGGCIFRILLVLLCSPFGGLFLTVQRDSDDDHEDEIQTESEIRGQWVFSHGCSGVAYCGVFAQQWLVASNWAVVFGWANDLLFPSQWAVVTGLADLWFEWALALAGDAVESSEGAFLGRHADLRWVIGVRIGAEEAERAGVIEGDGDAGGHGDG